MQLIYEEKNIYQSIMGRNGLNKETYVENKCKVIKYDQIFGFSGVN